MKKNILAAALLIFGALWCFGQSNFATGEDFFMQNKPREAIVYLENAIAEDPLHVMAFLYLGVAYEQIDHTDEAIAVYRQILDHAGDLTANVASNLGNVFFRKGSAAEAESLYSQALEANHIYAPAYLGRANARLKNGALREAVTDYEQYLLLDPLTAQRAAIQRLVAYIRTEFAETERRRIVAEDNARLEAERRQLEAERRQRLLDEVSESLHGAAGASQGLSSGAETVEGYEGEFELE